MSILSIAIVLIFLIDEVLGYSKSSKIYRELPNPIAYFEVKKWISVSVFLMFLLVNSIVIYFMGYLIVADLLFMFILDVTILLKLYKSVDKVTVFDEGILVKGIFIRWYMIDDISEYENGNYIICSEYLSGSSIKTGIIKNGEGFKKISHEMFMISRDESEHKADDSIDKPFFGIIAESIIRLRDKKNK